MPVWKDVTTYRQWGVAKEDPQTWEARAGAFRVVVTRHIHYPGTWVLQTYPDIIGARDLNTDDVAEAKKRGWDLVHKALKNALKEMDR